MISDLSLNSIIHKNEHLQLFQISHNLVYYILFFVFPAETFILIFETVIAFNNIELDIISC